MRHHVRLLLSRGPPQPYAPAGSEHLARTRDPRHDLACMRNRLGSTDFEEQVSVAARMRVWAHVELD